jgi:hypothetical protein
VIDCEQFLAPLAHLSLGGEKVFGRRFVSVFGVPGDVSEAIDRAGVLRVAAADEAAAFGWSEFASMSNHCVEVFAKEANGRHSFSHR